MKTRGVTTTTTITITAAAAAAAAAATAKKNTEKIIEIFSKRFLNGDNNDCNIDKRDEENLLHKLKKV